MVWFENRDSRGEKEAINASVATKRDVSTVKLARESPTHCSCTATGGGIRVGTRFCFTTNREWLSWGEDNKRFYRIFDLKALASNRQLNTFFSSLLPFCNADGFISGTTRVGIFGLVLPLHVIDTFNA